MSDYDYGPLQTYEITWTSGHVEKVRCHQVSYTGDDSNMLGLIGVKTQNERRVHLYGMINRRWLLVLSACEADIASLRLMTEGEEFHGVRFTFDADGGQSSPSQGGAA